MRKLLVGSVTRRACSVRGPKHRGQPRRELAADTVPKIEMHAKMASELQSSNRTG